MVVSKGWNLLGCVLLASAFSAVARNPMDDMKVGGFRVPDYNKEGEMVSQFFGESAALHSSGDVKIDGVRVEFYREGTTFLTVESPYCFYNQKTRDAHSDAPVMADMKGILVSGTGFKLGVASRTVELMADSKVVLEGVLGSVTSAVGAADPAETPAAAAAQDAVAPAQPEALDVTTITSTQLFLNYAERSARFVESVRVANPQLDLTCETLDILFSEENEMQQIDARGGCVVGLFDGSMPADSADKNQELALTSETLKIEFAGDNQVKQIDAQGGCHVQAFDAADPARQDPDLDLTCATLQVRFAGQNVVDQIDALGGSRVEIFDVMTQTEDPFLAQGARQTNDTTVITSRDVFMNNTDRKVRFVDHVHVVDAEMTLDSESLEMHFGESNEINWIEAVGKVRLLSDGREAIAGRAIYHAQRDEFLLEEEPRLIEGRNMLTGDRIRFWRSEKRMICEPQARAVVFPDDKVKTDIFEY